VEGAGEVEGGGVEGDLVGLAGGDSVAAEQVGDFRDTVVPFRISVTFGRRFGPLSLDIISIYISRNEAV
jgi:hypothetical protein